MGQVQQSNRDRKRRLPLFRFWAVYLVVGVGLAGSFLAFRYTQDQERSLAQARFERTAVNISASLTKDIDRYIDLLHSIRRLFDASTNVERNSFSIFCEGPISRNPGIQALEWVPRVPHAERKGFEKSAASDGFTTFQITDRDREGRLIPAPDRAEYFPIYYVEPYQGNESALGHDYQDSTRMAVMEKARDTGVESASGPLTLIQETGDQLGVLLFLPIYGGGVPETQSERRTQLLGYAEGVFRIGDMVEASLQGLSMDGIGLRLTDLTTPGKPAQLFSRGGQPDGAHETRYLSRLNFGGREWSLDLYPTAPVGGKDLPLDWLVLGGGLFITTLAGAYVFAETTRNAKIAQTVEERTAELHHTIQEAALRQAELDQARELDRLKTNFVGAVSHDLRTPLTSIMGYAEFLEDEIGGELGPQQLEFVQQIHKGARRLEYLLNDLLDFARLDAGTFKLTLGHTDLQAKLQEVAESLKPQVDEAQLTLMVAAPETSLIAPMDAPRIERVLINLLTNAIKFTLPGGTIRLEARLDGDQLICEVQDSGEGIAPADIPKLFRHFSQLSNGMRRGGTGLGLSICKAIIEAHGGAIGVRSSLGKGSTFWFSLPV
ncbi:Alginate biosynthesis sensor protein KinB [compost metagenome]